MKVYLAGPMRGYPLFNFPAFEEAQARWESWGHVVLSPAEEDKRQGFNPATDQPDDKFMRRALYWDMNAIFEVDCIIVLENWEHSRGARAEVALGMALGIDIRSAAYGELVDCSCLIPQRPLAERVALDEDILEEAQRLTSGEREQDYGPPRQDFKRTAGFWTIYLLSKITVGANGKIVFDLEPYDVAVMMMFLKASRLCWSPDKRDNWVDMAGYSRCGWLCIQDGKQEQEK